MSRREPISIMLRRREEDRLFEAGKTRAEHVRLSSIADFEKRSSAITHGALMRKRIAEQNNRLRDEVDDRRRRLALLLNAEHEQLEREIAASYETPDQVKARLFAYARKLKEENEARRRALAAELDKKRFIMSSDVLRARASEITNEKTAAEWAAQVEEKRRMKAAEAETARREDALENTFATKLFERADVEKEARRRMATDVRGTLGVQVAVKKELTAAERRHAEVRAPHYQRQRRAGRCVGRV